MTLSNLFDLHTERHEGYPYRFIRYGLLSGLDAPYNRPGGGQESSRDEDFDGVAGDEGQESGDQGLARVHVRDHSQPGYADEINDNRAGEHRQQRGGETAIQAALTEPADDEGRERIRPQVARRWGQQQIEQTTAGSKNRQTARAFRQIEQGCQRAAPTAQRRSRQHHDQRLQRDWYRREA